MLDLLRRYVARRRAAVTVFRRQLNELIVQYSVDGPVCHAGSKNRDGTEASIVGFRALFASAPHPEFIGIDIEPGPNVDLVADLASPALLDNHPELRERFGFVFCSALLEHVENPFATAANLEHLLRQGGHLYYAGPWVWGYHPYPDDYWRISVSGLRALFPRMQILDWWYEGTNPHTGLRIREVKNERTVLQQFSISGPARQITDRGMPYLNIAAIAVRR